MEQYIVSARKYRPDSFESLIGQDNIAQTLKNSIIRGQLAHAYLFCGPRGVGKTSAARIFAKIINCEHPTDKMEPCCECESCRSFQEGRSYCIHELDAASNNGVDDIKALIDQVNIPPQVGKYSVYIIDEVHMLSSAAFNAFLKTLEEPPAHAIFILATTEKHKILPTILSRCQTYDFNRISIPDIVRNLRGIATKENITIDDESLHVIALKADGAMRDALTIFDQTVAFCGTDVKYADVLKNLNMLDYEHCFNLVDDFLSGNYQAALLKFDEILQKGFNALHFVAALSSHFRDLIVSKSGGLDSLLELPDSLKAKYQEQAFRCPMQFLYDGISITTACETGYKASINPRLHIELALMRLSFLCGKAVSLSAPRIMVPAENVQQAAPLQAKANVPETAPAVKAEPVVQPEPVSLRPAEAQPVAQPAVQPVLQPVAEPAAPAQRQPRKRPTRGGSSLSISSISAEGKTETESKIEQSVGDELPSDDKMTEAWKKLPEEFAERPRLAGALSSAQIEITDNGDSKILVFYVTNSAQQQWIADRLLRDIETKFRILTGSSKVGLSVDVAEAPAAEKIDYTESEKAKKLIQTNPEVANLVKDLGLDV